MALPIKLKSVLKHSKKKIKRKSDGGIGDDFFAHHSAHSGPHLKGKGAEHATYDFDDNDYDVEGGLQNRKDKQKRGYEPAESTTTSNVANYQSPLSSKLSTRAAMNWDDEDDSDELLGGLRDVRKKNAKKFKKEGISDKMSVVMSKLAKSLGIKSVVSMHTGKGSLSYFLDDEKEALKLQKMLKKSFKRVRKINLDKSEGDTANFVVAADMLGLESVNEGKLESLALNLLRNINKEAGVKNYNHNKTADFNKVVKFLKGKMPRVPNQRIGQIAMSYHDYRKRQPKIKIPDIDSVKDMEKILKKLGMKEGVYEKNRGKTLYGKDLVKYFVKRFKYSTRDAIAVANKLKDVGFKVPKVLPKYESVNEVNMAHVYSKDLSKKKFKDLGLYLWHVLDLAINKDFRVTSNGKLLAINIDKINPKSLRNIKKRFGVDLKQKAKEPIRLRSKSGMGKISHLGMESVNEMSKSKLKKMRDEFEETGELPPHLKKLVKDIDKIEKKYKVTNIVVPGLEWMSKLGESTNKKLRK